MLPGCHRVFSDVGEPCRPYTALLLVIRHCGILPRETGAKGGECIYYYICIRANPCESQAPPATREHEEKQPGGGGDSAEWVSQGDCVTGRSE